MKLSVICATLALAITSVEACAKYTTCWCERSNVEYQGKIQDNVPWDEDTAKACVDPGKPGYYGMNYQECYRYKKMFPAFIPSKAINNCDWRKKCVSVGATTGYCRGKL